jgi:hypothetical protein
MCHGRQLEQLIESALLVRIRDTETWISEAICIAGAIASWRSSDRQEAPLV